MSKCKRTGVPTFACTCIDCQKPTDPKPGDPVVRAHGPLCMCNLCRNVPVQEHPDAFE